MNDSTSTTPATTAQPTERAAGIAADIAAYAAEPYSTLSPYALGYLESAAAAVVDDPSPRNLAHLADTLAGVGLAKQQHRDLLARRVAEAKQHLAEVECRGGVR